jgi:hypothetical protein
MGILDLPNGWVGEDRALRIKGGVSVGMVVFGYTELMDPNWPI